MVAVYGEILVYAVSGFVLGGRRLPLKCCRWRQIFFVDLNHNRLTEGLHGKNNPQILVSTNYVTARSL